METIAEMAWLSQSGSDDETKFLHLRMTGCTEFSPYWEFPFAVKIEALETGNGTEAHLKFCNSVGAYQEPIAHSSGWFVFQALNKNGVRLRKAAIV
jgi:hypothetical protein